MTYPDISMELARLRIDERLKQAERERQANAVLRAAPNFVPTSRWRDPAFYTVIVAPIVALGFLGYFAQQIISGIA
jgi:hypothetical protein